MQHPIKNIEYIYFLRAIDLRRSQVVYKQSVTGELMDPEDIELMRQADSDPMRIVSLNSNKFRSAGIYMNAELIAAGETAVRNPYTGKPIDQRKFPSAREEMLDDIAAQKFLCDRQKRLAEKAKSSKARRISKAINKKT